MKNILLILVSALVIGCEHSDDHNCYHHDCDYHSTRHEFQSVRRYLEDHKSDVPSSDYRRYFSPYFEVYGPVYCNTENPRLGNMRLERFVEDRDSIDFNYHFIYSYTRFYYPPTGEEYYIVEYYKNW